jgi:hypothetical protein
MAGGSSGQEEVSGDTTLPISDTDVFHQSSSIGVAAFVGSGTLEGPEARRLRRLSSEPELQVLLSRFVPGSCLESDANPFDSSES